jgi:hypothetical protein
VTLVFDFGIARHSGDVRIGRQFVYFRCGCGLAQSDHYCGCGTVDHDYEWFAGRHLHDGFVPHPSRD